MESIRTNEILITPKIKKISVLHTKSTAQCTNKESILSLSPQQRTPFIRSVVSPEIDLYLTKGLLQRSEDIFKVQSKRYEALERRVVVDYGDYKLRAALPNTLARNINHKEKMRSYKLQKHKDLRLGWVVKDIDFQMILQRLDMKRLHKIAMPTQKCITDRRRNKIPKGSLLNQSQRNRSSKRLEVKANGLIPLKHKYASKDLIVGTPKKNESKKTPRLRHALRSSLINPL